MPYVHKEVKQLTPCYSEWAHSLSHLSTDLTAIFLVLHFSRNNHLTRTRRFCAPPFIWPGLMLCHCANEEEHEKNGGMNLGHKGPCISSLHSATIRKEIDLWLTLLFFPSCLEPEKHTQTHIWTCGKCQSMETVFFRLYHRFSNSSLCGSPCAHLVWKHSFRTLQWH